MNDVSIVYVTTESKELNDARLLFTQYVNELNEDLAFQSLAAELKDPLKKYGAPYGSLYVAYKVEKAVGCVALQPITSETCEMKRLYVNPAYRKHGIATQLVDLILKDATNRGYTHMVLDTLDRLTAAIKLYRRHGFAETEAYYENPLPGVVYMQKQLL